MIGCMDYYVVIFIIKIITLVRRRRTWADVATR